ncbi:hypothetical protein [Tautonia sociabilis]|uniref:Uncharacterized protein n=1 Tax=Tautonia sociabilis TaxID=2080755 RepID=A0A432MML0_9BACT|nr:hypothetical protein [Tautonia sociabilis]RUL88684.1 hypothetical protein TsocGM_05975 [Tautonia sociabilis]
MRLRSKHTLALAGLVVAATATAAVLPGQGLDSGPKLGTVVDAFDVYDVTGPNQGRELCYR